MLKGQDAKPGDAIREELSRHSAELALVKATLDQAYGTGAKSSSLPEDRVLFPLGVSCRDILEEILFAVVKGFGRSALRSARTMYECAVFSRHIHLHPEKADDFLARFHAQYAKIIQNIPDAEKGMPKMHADISAKVPKYGKGKRVGVRDLDWSDRNTLEMAKEAGALRELHCVAFDFASAFVHPSAVFILNQMSHSLPGKSQIQVGTKSQDEEATLALRIAHDLILNVVDLRLKYSPSDSLEERLEACKKDFIKIWGYPPHI